MCKVFNSTYVWFFIALDSGGLAGLPGIVEVILENFVVLQKISVFYGVHVVYEEVVKFRLLRVKREAKRHKCSKIL